MSTNDCDSILAKLIDTIINHEKQVEEIKLQLAKTENFCPFSIFKSLNASRKGFLTEEDLNTFLRFYGYSVSKIDLKRLVASDRHKANKITYNDFLNQILPMSDIDLRNEVLQRADLKNVEINEEAFRDINRLITAIYQSEIEHLRALEIDKKRLLDYDISLIDVSFLCLSDDVSHFLSYKSIATFMKRCGFPFGKIEYECFIRRIDKESRGRVSVTDFKHILLPLDAIHQLNGYLHSQPRSTIEGISPIKSIKTSSAKKNNINSDHQVPVVERTSAALKKSSLSPTRKYDVDTDIRIPAGQTKNSKAASQVTFNDRPFGSGQTSREDFYTRDNQNIYQADQYMPASSNRNFYNPQIATIQDQLMYQNVPELDIKHPLENRFLDPLYHNYWSYSRQHNTTLSPEYLNMGEHNLKSKINSSLYYNPTFLEPGSYENPQRYPDNPFRHTDHGHYFQNYYNNLRSDFYNQYYNFIPYKTKVTWAASKAQSSADRSHNSPMRSDQEYNESQFRKSGGVYQSHQVPDQESPYKKSPSRQGNSSRGLAGFKSSNQFSSGGEYKMMSLSQAQRLMHEDSQVHNRSAIKIDSPAVQREQESGLDAFIALGQPVGDVKPDTPDDVEDMDDKPYKYVIVHS